MYVSRHFLLHSPRSSEVAFKHTNTKKCSVYRQIRQRKKAAMTESSRSQACSSQAQPSVATYNEMVVDLQASTDIYNQSPNLQPDPQIYNQTAGVLLTASSGK
jgi:hypothetical protein